MMNHRQSKIANNMKKKVKELNSRKFNQDILAFMIIGFVKTVLECFKSN